MCRLFGADEQTLQFTVQAMPLYSWGFVVMSLNTIISSYLYSTKRTRQSDIINILRSLIVNTAVILLLPRLFGNAVIWHTFGIGEAIVLVASVCLLRQSERDGIPFQ